MQTSYLKKLTGLMKQLRDQERGCSWDLAQTHESLSRYVIEEAYEVAHALTNGDSAEIRDELGDLLFQIVIHAQIAEEAGAFNLEEVARTSYHKMVRRHPHIFQAKSGQSIREERPTEWESIKARERHEKKISDGRGAAPGILEGIARALPALVRSSKILLRLDHAKISLGIEKEIRTMLDSLAVPDKPKPDLESRNADYLSREKECGAFLFACASLVRKHGIDPESALRDYNTGFEKRFAYLEKGKGLIEAENNKQRTTANLEYLCYGATNLKDE